MEESIRAGAAAEYPKIAYEIGAGYGILHSNRQCNKVVTIRPDLPGNVIVIHGVNDVGVSYDKVEAGLCEGLSVRLKRELIPAQYRIPQEEDRNVLLEDPDAMFFKRTITDDTSSPVIPFYWGYREVNGKNKTLNGQYIDRYGNRLDKDLSKGGGPFANATNTLPDMWRRGFSALPGNLVDSLSHDPLRPVLKAPGRLYMVLAAQRLAALIAMIRDFDADETVSIVAHSQGCLISLLAQAFLLQRGLRPADTLVLTHPPYSLVDDMPFLNNLVDAFQGGADEAMAAHYASLGGRQTFQARLQTLINIVAEVARARHAEPAFRGIDPHTHCGMVGARWEADADRDNRGKVYLYFCPEDMTVALNGMQGIGWQGVPDEMSGSRLNPGRYPLGQEAQLSRPVVQRIRRQPLRELGAAFFQRVFTAKRRPDPRGGQPVPVGLPPPHDFILHAAGEDDHAHVASGADTQRSHLPRENALHRAGIRTINGERLPEPVMVDMNEGGLSLPGQPSGAHEQVDPLDAAIAITSDYGLQEKWECVADPFGVGEGMPLGPEDRIRGSPHPVTFGGRVVESPYKVDAVRRQLNQDKNPEQCCEVLDVFTCLGHGMARPNGQVLVRRKETPDEARLRWQHGVSARSFHGAIFGGRANHAKVTAYDVAIGSGKACSHPLFYAYLCAVADWRLKKLADVNERARPSILRWEKFIAKFAPYWEAEPEWRRQLIEGNADYYSKGELPTCLPLLPRDLPPTVIFETLEGKTIAPLRENHDGSAA